MNYGFYVNGSKYISLGFLLTGVVLLAYVLVEYMRPEKVVAPLAPRVVPPKYGELGVLPPSPQLSSEVVELGRVLFHDPRLSKDNTVSCSSCHNISRGGVDGQQFSIGVQGRRGERNSPTVLNSGFLPKLFWDGRAKSLEEQAHEPVHNPLEMDTNWETVIAKLKLDQDLSQAFERVFPAGWSGNNIARALADFQRSLVTPNAPFDRFLSGEKEAMEPSAIRGYNKFLEYGCSTCHEGPTIGGKRFQKIGKMENFFKGREPNDSDLGLFNISKRQSDRFKFRVPSLRNVALTAPYFHDGSAQTLEDAVSTMALVQLGDELPTEDRDDIVDFLKSLTGQLPPQSTSP